MGAKIGEERARDSIACGRPVQGKDANATGRGCREVGEDYLRACGCGVEAGCGRMSEEAEAAGSTAVKEGEELDHCEEIVAWGLRLRIEELESVGCYEIAYSWSSEEARLTDVVSQPRLTDGTLSARLSEIRCAGK